MKIWFIWEITIIALETSIISAMLYAQLGVARNKRKYILLGIIAIILIISILNLLDIQMSIEIANSIIIYLSRLVGFILFIAFSFLVFSGSFSEKIIWTSVPPFVMTISDFVALEVMQRITSQSVGELTQFGSARICVSGIYLFTACTIYITLIYISRKKEKSEITLPFYLQVLLVFILLLGTVTVDQLIDFSLYANDLSATAFNNKMAFISISFLIIILGIFILMQKVGKLTQDLLQAQHYKISHDNYKDLERSYTALKEAKHDIRNHMQILHGLLTDGDDRRLKDYFEEINGQYMQMDTVLTNNTPLNVLLNSKILLAKSCDIDFQYKIHIIRELTENYSGICSLIANLLDNAIDACCNVLDAMCRYIHFEMLEKEEMILINIENSTDGHYKKSGEIYLSRKSGMLHGMGLGICKNIVNQYGGYMDISADLRQFTVNIMLPLDNLIKEKVNTSNEKNRNHRR